MRLLASSAAWRAQPPPSAGGPASSASVAGGQRRRRGRDSSSSSKIGLSTATAACCCCCLSFGLFLLALPPSPSAVAQAFHLPSLQPPRPTTTFVGGCFIAPTRRPGAGRRRLLPGSLPPRALLAAATTEPPHVAPPPPAAAAAAAAAQPAAHDAAVDAATTPSTDGGRSGLTAALDALALKGRHQEALALLRSARDGSHPLFGPGEVGPVQYHKVVLACKQGRQWALALDLLREMRQVSRESGMQIMLHTYGAAMDACASAGQLDRALEAAAWMEEGGHPLNRVAYTTLIKACAEARQGARALEVLGRMRRQREPPVTLDYLGYLKVVELLGSSGLLEEALGELAHLRAQQQAAEDAEEEEGHEERDARERGALVADHRIYFSLVRNALAHGLPDAAARALGAMAAMGCAPPPPAMKLLWDAVIKAGHPREGLSLLEALVASSSSSPAMPVMAPPTYHSTRLRLLLAAGDRAGAMAELEHMAQHRLPLIDHRAVSAAIRLFAPSSPSPDSPRSASAAAAAAPEEVIALVAALRRVGGRLDVVHYTTAINHAGKRGGGVGNNKATAKAGAGGRRDGVEEGALEAAQKGAERARALLAWMAEDGVKPNDVTYTSLIHIFGQAGDLDAARGLLETRMAEDGVTPSGITVCALLNAYCRGGKVDEALALFDSLPQRGLPRDARVYAAVMQALLAQGRGEEVQGYLERMAQEGIRPDGRILALQARLRFQRKDWKGALRLLKDADAAGVALDGRFFTVLLDGLAQGGHLAKCWETLRQMRARGVPPNAFAYAALLKAFTTDQTGGHGGSDHNHIVSSSSSPSSSSNNNNADPERLQQYIRTFERAIKEEGLRPTVINYNALMEACGKVGDAAAALGFFEQMKATGLTPDVVSHSVLIKAHALSGDLDGAFRLLGVMVAEGRVAPTHRTFNPLVDRCARAGRTDLVDRILAQMASLPPSLGGPLAPDVVTYNSLLTALAARGETQAAERLVEGMVAGCGGKPPPNVVTFNILMDHYSGLGQWEECRRTLQERMRAAHVQPDAQTYNHLLDGLARAGKVAECEATLHEMREAAGGLRPDSFTAAVMLGLYSKSGDLAKLDAFLELLRAEGVEPPAPVMVSLLRTYLRHMQPERAMALLDARRRSGGRANPVPKAHYSFIVQHLFDSGRIGEGFRYLEQLGTQSVRLDGRCYAILARGLLERGQGEAAGELLLGDMRRRRVPLCKELGPVLVAVGRAVPAREAEARAVVQEMVMGNVLMSHAAAALWAEAAEGVAGAAPPI